MLSTTRGKGVNVFRVLFNTKSGWSQTIFVMENDYFIEGRPRRDVSYGKTRPLVNV